MGDHSLGHVKPTVSIAKGTYVAIVTGSWTQKPSDKDLSTELLYGLVPTWVVEVVEWKPFQAYI